MSNALRALTLTLLVQPAAATSLHTIYSFANGGHGGFAPAGQITADAAGNLYGIATDREYGDGAVYKLTLQAKTGKWTAAQLWQFVPGAIGFAPSPGLSQGGAPRQFFGATDVNFVHQNSGCGSVFQLTVTRNHGAATRVSRRNNGSGCYPIGPVNVGPNGDVYAMSLNGGESFGGIQRFKPPKSGELSWTQQLIYSFTGQADGFYPQQPMLLSRTGALYGATLASSNGQRYPVPLFRLAPPPPHSRQWVFSLAYQFSLAECSDGVGQLIEDQSLTIYGPCSDNVVNGVDQPGNVFSLTPPANPQNPWTKTLLYSFTGGADGGHPINALTLDEAGNLYGTTPQGHGTIFRLSPPQQGQTTWTETTLYTFSGADGDMPSSPLLLTKTGTLIGTTLDGGAGNAGTMFELTP